MDGARLRSDVDQTYIEQKLQSEPQVLTDFLRRIHPRAPKARVLVVTYQQIIPSSGATCAGVQLTAEHAPFEHDVGQRLQVAFQRAAAHSEAQLVDTYAPSANHNACATTDPWVSAWTWGFFPTGTIAFHPTIEGMTAAADQIVARLRRQSRSGACNDESSSE